MDLTVPLAVALERKGDSEGVAEQQERLLSYLRNAAFLKCHVNALQKCKQVINVDTEDYISVFQELLEKEKLHFDRNNANDEELKKHKYYKKFRTKVWQVNHPGEALPEEQDDDLLVMPSQAQEYMCPLTMEPLTDPLTNSICGHSYNKNAIIQYIRSNRRRGGSVACPVAGCTSVVQESKLEFNVELQKDVIREKRRREHERATQEVEDIVAV